MHWVYRVGHREEPHPGPSGSFQDWLGATVAAAAAAALVVADSYCLEGGTGSTHGGEVR
jgi:hypothetical protein